MNRQAARARLRATTPLAVLTLAVVWLGLAPAARADGAIMFVGKIEARERGVIRTAIEDTAKQLGWSFSERTFPDHERDDILACLELDRPSTCIDGFLHANKIDKLTVVQVGTERSATPGKALDVIVTQQVVAPGAAAVFIQRRTCEQCDDDTLRQHVRAMTKKLLEDAASGTSKTILAIKSSPPGAWITLDGDSAGATDSTVATFPGKHTVMLSATGYETEVRDVTAVEGKTTEVAVTLRPTQQPGPTDPATPGAHGDSRLVPWIVASAGAASLVAGAILIGIDQDPDASPDAPFEIRDTAPAGVGFVIGGAIVAGIGGYLALRPRATTTTSRPTAAVSPTNVSLGWEVRF